MSNNNILSKKLPYADQFSSTEECLNYMVKTLNSTFKDSPNSSSGIVGLEGVSFSQSFSFGVAVSSNSSYTFNHNLGVIPSGFLIIDQECDIRTASGFNMTISRISWTTTNIVISLTVSSNVAVACNGSFKILVLR
jgi:hypothetical protein